MYFFVGMNFYSMRCFLLYLKPVQQLSLFQRKNGNLVKFISIFVNNFVNQFDIYFRLPNFNK